MISITLHGHLKELYPLPIQVEAGSAAEAVQYLSQIPALNIGMGKFHTVQLDGFDSIEAIYERRHIKEIHIRPVMAGAGKPGVAQIVIGVIIIAAAVLSSGATLAAMGVTSGQLVMVGGMMVLGGVLQLMAPQPSINSSSEEKSRYLGNGRNTTAIGTRIPMIYGRRRAFGQYISFDIDADKFDAAPAQWYSSPFTDYGDLTNSAAPPALPLPDPGEVYNQPTSRYRGIVYPLEMQENPVPSIMFDPVELLVGEWNMNFTTGQILRVSIASNGVVNLALLLGGEINVMPPNGTTIAFTRNYG